MNNLHIECPHCGASFDVQIEGDMSNMMVFPCAKCQTPLMCYHGEIVELDRDEFANLRKRLSRVIDVVMKQDSSVSEVADSLRKMVEISNAKAAARLQENSSISEDDLSQLEKDLAEMDVDSFLDKI